MSTIDAKGLSCPEPVILLRKAMTTGEAEYTILVDNHAAKENTTRYAAHMGYTAEATQSGSEYTLVFKK